jgi:anaerobic magnesium-protoporphyrin IX monomethyl ester cyclase
MKRILFIVPPNIRYDDYVRPGFNERQLAKEDGTFNSLTTDMPIGILSLSAYVKKHAEVQSRLCDFNVILNEQADFPFLSFRIFFDSFFSQSEIADSAPDIVAISCLFTPAYRNMLDIAAICRKAFPQACIVAGGGVPTNLYREIFRDSDDFDALCYGEGEKPMLGLVEAPDRRSHITNSPSWITKEKAFAGAFFSHNPIEDLDEIPFYDYDLCKIEDYRANPTAMAHGDNRQHDAFPIMTSRGCPHRCCFCASHSVHGRRMRFHSLRRIKDDLSRLKSQYDAKTIAILDDHFLFDQNRALNLIDILNKVNVTVFPQNGLALRALNREILIALRSAGVDSLSLPLESGSQRVLSEIMRKPLDLSQVRQTINDCRDLGFYVHIQVMIGLPGETKEDIEETRRFLRTLNANWFMLYCASPLPGSEMYDICVANKYFPQNDRCLESDFKHPVIQTEDFTPDYIKETAYSINLDVNFVHNPDCRLGEHASALIGFERALRARKDHAIALYYASKCHQVLGDLNTSREYLRRAQDIASWSPFWRKQIASLEIPLYSVEHHGQHKSHDEAPTKYLMKTK